MNDKEFVLDGRFAPRSRTRDAEWPYCGRMDGSDAVARILGIAGIGLSLLGLIWQLITWRLSGARIRVEGRITPQPVEGGGQEDAFFVIARNKGRLPIAVTQWAVGICRGRWSLRRLVRRPLWFTWKDWPEEWQGPDVPYTIPGHHSAEWRLRYSDVLRAVQKNETGEVSLHGTVILATGRLRASKETNRWRPSRTTSRDC